MVWMHARRESVRGRFAVMRDALNATGQPIVYSIDDWGVTNTWTYGTTVLLHADLAHNSPAPAFDRAFGCDVSR